MATPSLAIEGALSCAELLMQDDTIIMLRCIFCVKQKLLLLGKSFTHIAM
jgi:hypothetical protein